MPRAPKRSEREQARPNARAPKRDTRFKPGNKAAAGRGIPTAALLRDAMEEAVLNVVNTARKKAWHRLARVDIKLADELFSPTTDRLTAFSHMFEELARRASFGDKTAQKILWDRYFPKERLPAIELDKGIEDMPPDQAAALVASKVARGEITADVGESLIRVFSGAATIREAEANARLMNAMAEEEEKLK